MKRLLAALAMVAVTAWPADGVVRSYPLGLTEPELAAAAVRPLLSPGGTAVPDAAHHRLIVVDVPEVQARVAEAVRQLDVPARNVRLFVTTRRTASSHGEGVSGSVRIGPAGTGVAVAGGAGREERRGNAQQQILTLSGGHAEIEVARETPEAAWLWSWGTGRGLVPAGVQWRSVGTSLMVEPVVLPDGRIRVRVTPHLSWDAADGRGSVDVQTLSTEVVVAPGEEVDLGGLPMRDEEFHERFLIGFSSSGARESVAIRLRAQVE